MINRKYFFECDGGDAGGAPAGGEGGISAGGDVSPIQPSGECNHLHDGYMGNCFHMPVPMWGLAYNGSKRPNKKKKKRKHSYDGKVKIIKNYDDLVSESNALAISTCVFVLNIPLSYVDSIAKKLASANARFDIQQFKKNLDCGLPNVELVGLFSKDSKECLALAMLIYDCLGVNDCCINKVMSFANGYGSLLIRKIISHTENTWLMADPDYGKELCEKVYGNIPELNEVTIGLANAYYDGKNHNRDILHLFYADNCANPKEIELKLRETYTRR